MSLNVTGSSSDEVIESFNLPNPSSRTMTLWSAHPLADYQNILVIECGRCVRLTT
jgi:hypothetical protein